MNFQIIIQRDEDGCYIATCPAIHGCHTQGETYEEALQNIKEAIEINLEHQKAKSLFSAKNYQRYPRIIATEDLSIA